jgi:hypothetical protein
MAKVTRETIIDHLIEFQLKMIGKTLDEVKTDPQWFDNNTFTVEQLTDFNVYALPLIKKVYKCNNKKAKETLGFFNLGYGLRVVPTRDERIDIIKKLEDENRTANSEIPKNI